MIFNSLFSGLGAAVVISFIGLVLAPFPIFNLTLEEKALLNTNFRFVRKVLIEIGIFLMFLIMSISLVKFTLKGHNVTNVFPFINNYIFANYLLIIGGFITLTGFLILVLIRLNRRFRKFIFDKFRKLKNMEKKIAKLVVISLFIVIFYIYMFAPILLTGFFSNLFLLMLGNSYALEVSTTSNVLLELFSSIPETVSIIFIGFYLTQYVIARIIYSQLFAFGKLIMYSKVIANIYLVNGKELLNKTIIRPSIDGSILIGDPENIAIKILLPKQSILYMEFEVKHVSID